MKKSLLALAFSLAVSLSCTVHAAEPPQPAACAHSTGACSCVVNTAVPFDYKQTREWKRYTTGRAIGWSALGLGSAMVAGGFFWGALEAYGSGHGNVNGPNILATSGAVMALASIPILAVSYSYRSKARKMTLGVAPADIQIRSLRNTSYNPGIALSLTF